MRDEPRSDHVARMHLTADDGRNDRTQDAAKGNRRRNREHGTE